MKRMGAIAALFLISGLAHAQMSATELIAAVDANFSRIQTLSCTLTITATVRYTRTGMGDATSVTAFRYWLKRPGKMRVETVGGPTLACDGTTWWQLVPGSAAVPLTGRMPGTAVPPAELWHFSAALAGQPLKVTDGPEGVAILAASGRSYTIRPSDGCVLASALRDPSGAVYAEMAVTYSAMGDAMVPISFIMAYHGDANTTTMTYTFGDVVINEDVADGLFSP